ncbi:MAG: STAS domain-containing protein [Clostridiales bacterium]|nr:STAS domain-containing protein [Clostridiales bacterium]
MSSELKITEELAGESIAVSITGEIDIYTAQILREKLYAIADSNKMDLKIECRELNYIDSTGLGIFVGVLKKTKSYGKNIHLIGLKENIKKLFLITGLDKLFIIE